MTDEAKPIYFKREQLVGKLVVSSDASIIGTVEDIVATSEGKMGFHIAQKNPSGECNSIIGSDDIQAMGDVILLKQFRGKAPIAPQPAPPPSPGSVLIARSCSRCGFANASNSRFCIKCGLKLD